MKKFLTFFLTRREKEEGLFSYALVFFRIVWLLGTGVIIFTNYGSVTIEWLAFVIAVWTYILSIISSCASYLEACELVEDKDAKEEIRKILKQALVEFAFIGLLLVLVFFLLV